MPTANPSRLVSSIFVSQLVLHRMCNDVPCVNDSRQDTKCPQTCTDDKVSRTAPSSDTNCKRWAEDGNEEEEEVPTGNHVGFCTGSRSSSLTGVSRVSTEEYLDFTHYILNHRLQSPGETKIIFCWQAWRVRMTKVGTFHDPWSVHISGASLDCCR